MTFPKIIFPFVLLFAGINPVYASVSEGTVIEADALMPLAQWIEHATHVTIPALPIMVASGRAFHGFRNTAQFKSFEVLSTFISYIGATAVLFVLYMSWAKYNHLRFRNKTRRRAAEPVQPEDLAKFYGLEKGQIEKWQQAKILAIHHDGRGHIIGVEFGRPTLSKDS